MNESRRVVKRIFIAIIYLAVLVGLGTGGYFLFRPIPPPPPPPSPTVNPIEIMWSQVLPSGQDLYSVVAKVKNPNTNFGASNFHLAFDLYDVEEKLIAGATGESFIWPGEFKYLILNNVKSTTAPAKTSIRISDLAWREINNFGGIDLTVSNAKFGKGEPDSGKFFIVDFMANNNTPYDLNQSYVSMIIFNQDELPIAAATTLLENLKSKERRRFSVPWFSAFPGVPNRVDLTITTNLWETPSLIGE